MQRTPSWAKKLDELKRRASRVAVSHKGIAADNSLISLIDRVKSAGSISLAEAMSSAAVQETMRRSEAIGQEHELSIAVTGCFVSLQVVASGASERTFLLAVSRLDGLPHNATWEVVPEKFEKIRKRLGAPDRPAAIGPVAVHWSWPKDDGTENNAGIAQK